MLEILWHMHLKWIKVIKMVILSRINNWIPYEDSSYKPINTAFRVIDESRWQPLLVTDQNGVFFEQVCVYPQFRFLDGFTVSSNSSKRRSPPSIQE